MHIQLFTTSKDLGRLLHRHQDVLGQWLFSTVCGIASIQKQERRRKRVKNTSSNITTCNPVAPKLDTQNQKSQPVIKIIHSTTKILKWWGKHKGREKRKGGEKESRVGKKEERKKSKCRIEPVTSYSTGPSLHL